MRSRTRCLASTTALGHSLRLMLERVVSRLHPTPWRQLTRHEQNLRRAPSARRRPCGGRPGPPARADGRCLSIVRIVCSAHGSTQHPSTALRLPRSVRPRRVPRKCAPGRPWSARLQTGTVSVRFLRPQSSRVGRSLSSRCMHGTTIRPRRHLNVNMTSRALPGDASCHIPAVRRWAGPASCPPHRAGTRSDERPGVCSTTRSATPRIDATPRSCGSRQRCNRHGLPHWVVLAPLVRMILFRRVGVAESQGARRPLRARAGTTAIRRCVRSRGAP